MATPRIQTHAWSPSTNHQHRSFGSRMAQAATGLFGLGFSVGMLIRVAQYLGFGG